MPSASRRYSTKAFYKKDIKILSLLKGIFFIRNRAAIDPFSVYSDHFVTIYGLFNNKRRTAIRNPCHAIVMSQKMCIVRIIRHRFWHLKHNFPKRFVCSEHGQWICLIDAHVIFFYKIDYFSRFFSCLLRQCHFF